VNISSWRPRCLPLIDKRCDALVNGNANCSPSDRKSTVSQRLRSKYLLAMGMLAPRPAL
jgi:hypothetical protein